MENYDEEREDLIDAISKVFNCSKNRTTDLQENGEVYLQKQLMRKLIVSLVPKSLQTQAKPLSNIP